jgi:hypothetical protein
MITKRYISRGEENNLDAYGRMVRYFKIDRSTAKITENRTIVFPAPHEIIWTGTCVKLEAPPGKISSPATSLMTNFRLLGCPGISFEFLGGPHWTLSRD